jgi:hypothetical protein
MSRRFDCTRLRLLHGEFVLPPNKATAVNGHVHEHVHVNVDVAVVVHVLVDVAGLFIVK